ncbi:MAG TPA: phosphatase PAP2 family protein [Clostridia bacterium]|nr:phosphatase PAP2 family protein [Clostridia bacterium]
MQHILDFDWAIFQFVEKYLWSPFLDVLMPFITRLGDGGIIWILLAVVLLFFKKYRKFGFMMITGLLLSLLINDNILKPLISRPRPFELEAWKGIFHYPELIPRPDSLSFPSGHTSSSFAAAVVLIFTGKKGVYIPPLILAFLIAFSRIYVHVHYCTDVLAGMVVGIIYGLLAFLLVAKLAPFIQEKIKSKRIKESA